MSKQESLRQLLTRVHERLGDSHAVDAESRKLLVTLTRDIERKLGQNAKPDAGPTSSLKALAVQFEVDHPDLADALRRLVDALGKAGI
jgi:hypothetical protein